MRFLFVGDASSADQAGPRFWRTCPPCAQSGNSISSSVNGENSAGGFGITESICDDSWPLAPTR